MNLYIKDSDLDQQNLSRELHDQSSLVQAIDKLTELPVEKSIPKTPSHEDNCPAKMDSGGWLHCHYKAVIR